MSLRHTLLLVAAMLALALSACGAPADVRRPQPELQLSEARSAALWQQAQNVFLFRCVVCHGCYDAPCQLKLDSFAGIERGGSTQKVYDGARLTAATPTRLEVDAEGAAGWRELGFHPVLPEGAQTDPSASLLLRSVALGREHPLAPGAKLGPQYEFGLAREHVCPTAEAFAEHANKHPTWGMPFALPALTAKEEQVLRRWVQAGAPHDALGIEKERTRTALEAWEAFLNQDSAKGQLVSRYIFEHLFLATLRFDAGSNASAPEQFRLVRSRTRRGAVEEVNTRRPFDDPGTERVYYRFVLRSGPPWKKR